MKQYPQQKIKWPAPTGNLEIMSFCSAQQIRSYRFDSEFGVYAQYKSLYTKRESLEKKAKEKEANVVLAILDEKKIVGFGVLSHPDPDERWYALGPEIMIEIKAIEVSRKLRSTGMAKGIVKMMMSHPRIEEMIVYLVGFSWTWDLDGTQLTAPQYRKKLITLFEPYGFQEYQTNEPNICLRPENLFMGREGKKVTKKLLKSFKWLRFGIMPNEME